MLVRGKDRHLKLETVPLDAAASFAVLQFHGSHYPFFWHYHHEVEIALIIRGSGLRYIGDAVGHFDEGDLCLLGSNLPHCYVSQPLRRNPVHSMVIQFREDCLGERFIKAPETRAFRDLLVRAERGLQVRGETRRAVYDRLLEMLNQPVGSLEHLNGFLWIMTTLAQSDELYPLSVAGHAPLAKAASHERLNNVLKMLDASMPEAPSQSEIAAKARLSPPAFSRFFRRCMGKTYIEYVNELRIARVCRVLLESDVSVTEAAYKAGFNNLSNFNEQFRRLKNMTPREYRTLARAPEAPAARERRKPVNSFGGRSAKKLPPSIRIT
ncbi:MAG TPA: AraC family transcriptional regulator [Planctomycetota bacterium]|nr:AraC family transcriptional regulator [Planctomycetota bacterium]